MAHRLRLALFAGFAASMLALVGCGVQSGPNKSQLAQRLAQIQAYERQQDIEHEAGQRQWAAVQQRQWDSPRNISVEESDALIAALRSPSLLALVHRGQARRREGSASYSRTHRRPAPRNRRGAVRGHRSSAGCAQRRTRARRVSLGAARPGIPDTACEHAHLALDEKRSVWAILPAVKDFYATATDDSVRQRTAAILRRFESPPAEAVQLGREPK